MRDYLLGLITLPALTLLFVLWHTATARSAYERVWCGQDGWEIHPKASRLPWWYWTAREWWHFRVSRRHGGSRG